MNPKIWGRPGWTFLHLVTCEYPDNPTDQDKINYKQFFTDVQYILPCSKCKNHYASNLQKYPITENVLKDRYSLMNWLIDVHNQVNYDTGKKVLTQIEAYSAIQKMMKPKVNYWMISTVVLLIILVVIIFYSILKKRNLK